MPINYGDGATSRSIAQVYYKDGATQRTITEIWYGDGATKRQVYASDFSVSADGIADVAFLPDQTAQDTSTATTTGGVGPFTYSWAWVGTAPSGVSLSGTTTNTVTATFSSPVEAFRSGTLRVTVTDTGAGGVKTVDVSVNLEVA